MAWAAAVAVAAVGGGCGGGGAEHANLKRIEGEHSFLRDGHGVQTAEAGGALKRAAAR